MRLLLAGTGLILLSFFSRPADAAVNDLLRLPAVPSDKAASSLLLDIVQAGSRLVAVGERGHIIYSDDRGATWRRAKVPVMVTLTAVDFPTPEKGWAVGHDGIVLHTEDGGATWVKQMDGDQANRLLLANAERNLAENMARIDSGGVSEKDIQAEIEDQQWEVDNARTGLEEGPWKPFMDVEFDDQSRGFIIGAYGMIFRTEDGGKSWIPWVDRVPNRDLFHLNAFGKTRSGMFMVGEAGTLYRSWDNGMHWEAVESPYPGSFFGVITDPDNDTVVALGLRGNGYYSRDMGNTWAKLDIQDNTALNSGYLDAEGHVVILSSNAFFAPGLGEKFQSMDLPLSVYSAMVRVDEKNAILVGMNGVHKAALPDFRN